ncbi:MAG TPA: glycosyltransferase family 39 protein [Candidatus Acidoferrales bacterium]|nr:glycosyltransferase family 39 protein [Candidatus Acidoferrales bacterium]
MRSLVPRRPAGVVALVAFSLVAVGAVLVRFWDLSNQPGGLYPDEAAEGVDAHRLITDPSFHPVFFDDDGGREALFAYMTATAFRLAGASVTTLRGTAAAVGVVGVLLIWVAARRYGRLAALAGMAWAAGSLWLIAVSRDGFRCILVVPVGALALAGLLRWGDRPGRWTAVLAGAATGLGLWTYQPLKLLPVLTLAWLLWIRRYDADRFARLRSTLAWHIGAYVVVGGPMIWTAITDTRNYFARGVTSLFDIGGSVPESLPIHILKTIGMFLVTGDPNERHDVNALPLLGPVLFIPFAFGVWRIWRRRRDPAYALLLLGLVVFFLAPLLALEGGAPHFLRSLGLAPYVAAAIGLGCVELVRLARRIPKEWTGIATPQRTAAAAATVCAAALVLLGAVSFRTYLARPVEQRYDPYSFADVQLAAAARGGPGTAVVIADYDALDIRFLDAADPPTIVDPTQHIANAAVFSLIVAPTRADIARAAGSSIAARATAEAVDPRGNPVVWEVVP